MVGSTRRTICPWLGESPRPPSSHRGGGCKRSGSRSREESGRLVFEEFLNLRPFLRGQARGERGVGLGVREIAERARYVIEIRLLQPKAREIGGGGVFDRETAPEDLVEIP